MRTPPRLPLAFVVLLSLSACGGPAREPDAAGGRAPAFHEDPARPSESSTADGGPPDALPPARAAVEPPSIPSASVEPRPAPGAGTGRSPDANALTPSSDAAASREPRTREVTIPVGTTIRARLATALSSDSSQAEDPVNATLTAPLLVRGEEVVPSGATLRGEVLSVARSGKVKGRASLAFRFETLTVDGADYEARTERVIRTARATKGKDAQKIGIGAGAGALIGAIAGGGKGAAIGSAVGAGAGGGVVVATRGDEVRLAEGTTVTTKLREPVTVRVPIR